MINNSNQEDEKHFAEAVFFYQQGELGDEHTMRVMAWAIVKRLEKKQELAEKILGKRVREHELAGKLVEGLVSLFRKGEISIEGPFIAKEPAKGASANFVLGYLLIKEKYMERYYLEIGRESFENLVKLHGIETIDLENYGLRVVAGSKDECAA